MMLSLAVLLTAVTASATIGFHPGVEVGYDLGYTYCYSGTSNYLNGSEVSSLSSSYMNIGHGFHLGPTFEINFLEERKHSPALTIGLFYQYQNTPYGYMPSKDEHNYLKEVAAEQKAALEAMGAKNISCGINFVNHAIQLPVNARYNYTINDNNALFVFTGPVLQVNTALIADSKSNYTLDGKRNGMDIETNLLNGSTTTTTWVMGEKNVETEKDEHFERNVSYVDLLWDLGIGFRMGNFSISLSTYLSMYNSFVGDYRMSGNTPDWKKIDKYTGTVVYNALMRNDFKISLGYRFK